MCVKRVVRVSECVFHMSSHSPPPPPFLPQSQPHSHTHLTPYFRWTGLDEVFGGLVCSQIATYMCMWKDCSLEAPPKSTYAKTYKHMDNKSYFTQFLLVPCKTKWVGNRGRAKLAQVFSSFEFLLRWKFPENNPNLSDCLTLEDSEAEEEEDQSSWNNKRFFSVCVTKTVNTFYARSDRDNFAKDQSRCRVQCEKGLGSSWGGGLLMCQAVLRKNNGTPLDQRQL